MIEALRWKKFPLLSDGFVCLVDAMGDDQSIVQAARVSYGRGTRKTSDDRTLIRYLMRHHHTTPFEMVEIKLLVRVPMDCWRQWIRHRTASVNETSTRYSIAIDTAAATPPDGWRKQALSNRQGSEGHLSRVVGEELSDEEGEFLRRARELYEKRLALGVAREQARKDLPLSTYTEAYWKIDLHNLFHFLELRTDAHAQWEIRQYAETIGREIRPSAPAAGVGGLRGLPAGGDVALAAGAGGDRATRGQRPPARRRSRVPCRRRCELGGAGAVAGAGRVPREARAAGDRRRGGGRRFPSGRRINRGNRRSARMKAKTGGARRRPQINTDETRINEE